MFLKPGEVIQYLKSRKYLLTGMNGADFGCGSGFFTSLLADAVAPTGKVYAIDVQEDVLKEAQELLKNLQIKNVKFLLQDLEISSGLENEFLDFVFISQVLYQSDAPEKIVREARRILKKDGHLFVIEPQPESYLFRGQQIADAETTTNLIKNENFQLVEEKNFNDFYLLVFIK
ncbi:MAG: class I SAM-dependent methyltransferase [Patescibacteria group bacterium]|nr:class I SAM-dependent methyltransferase [Patescibacteria group bacterium]